MKIKTIRFGEIDIPEEEFILMKGSILGFERLSRFVVDAGIEPLVDSALPLADAREGFEAMVAGRVSGKVVFTI